MEILVEPTFQHITWVVRNFFELPRGNGFYLDSPEFLFGGDSYCFRLYPQVNRTNKTAFHVRRLSVTFRQRKVSCKVGFRRLNANGDENYFYKSLSLEENYFYPIHMVGALRDRDAPDGSLTVVCSMWLSTAGISTQEEVEQVGFPGHCASFVSRWSPTKMELTTKAPCTRVEWTVPNFFQLPREVGDSLASPEFRFAGDTYCFRFCLNGDTADSDLQLVRLTSNFLERTVSYRTGYMWLSWLVYPNSSRSLVGSTGFCVSRSKLEEVRVGYEWNDDLRVLVFLHLGEQSSVGTGQNWSGLQGIQKLQSDYRQLLQKKTESDACLVVCGKEFPVHRVVLRARSTVFEAMFGHDTAEKETGRVVIDDLDPDSFNDFLEYLYTGEVQAGLSDDNVFGLYMVADKYDVSTLKSECVEHMRQILSVESFCDVMSLARRHSEEVLLQQSYKFFKDNLKRIIRTAKWQQFMSANATIANELFMKAHEHDTQ